MKFSDKIYTYKDIEEAKKLIGKKVIGSDYLDCIERDYEGVWDKGVLTSVNTYSGSFEIDYRYTYQFIREVIEDEPGYRPFNNRSKRMTLDKARMILGSHMRCKGPKPCTGYCGKCTHYLSNEEIYEAEKFILEWIRITEKNMKNLKGENE